MRCANCGGATTGWLITCPCNMDEDLSEAKDMIDPVSQPKHISNWVWDFSPRGYYAMRGDDNGKLADAEMFWVPSDEIVWC